MTIPILAATAKGWEPLIFAVLILCPAGILVCEVILMMQRIDLVIDFSESEGLRGLERFARNTRLLIACLCFVGIGIPLAWFVDAFVDAWAALAAWRAEREPRF